MAISNLTRYGVHGTRRGRLPADQTYAWHPAPGTDAERSKLGRDPLPGHILSQNKCSFDPEIHKANQ